MSNTGIGSTKVQLLGHRSETSAVLSRGSGFVDLSYSLLLRTDKGGYFSLNTFYERSYNVVILLFMNAQLIKSIASCNQNLNTPVCATVHCVAVSLLQLPSVLMCTFLKPEESLIKSKCLHHL